MEPKRPKTIRFRFMRFRNIFERRGHTETASSCRNAVVSVQGAGSPQKKVERIKAARCTQTFSHEEIQPFQFSRNTFKCTVSNYIYQGALFKATKRIQKKILNKKFNATLTSPSWWGANAIIVCVSDVHTNPNTKPHRSG